MTAVDDLRVEIEAAILDYRTVFPEPYGLAPNLDLASRALSLLLDPDAERKTVQVLDNHDRRMATVRRVARWHLGETAWAHVLVGAYLDPDSADAELALEADDV